MTEPTTEQLIEWLRLAEAASVVPNNEFTDLARLGFPAVCRTLLQCREENERLRAAAFEVLADMRAFDGGLSHDTYAKLKAALAEPKGAKEQQ